MGEISGRQREFERQQQVMAKVHSEFFRMVEEIADRHDRADYHRENILKWPQSDLDRLRSTPEEYAENVAARNRCALEELREHGPRLFAEASDLTRADAHLVPAHMREGGKRSNERAAFGMRPWTSGTEVTVLTDLFHF